MMKLGFVTAILPELSLAEVMEFAASADFSCIEVMCWPKGKAERRYAGVTHIDVSDFNAAEIHTLEEKHGVSISGLGYYPNPLTPDEAEAKTYTDHIVKVIDASAALGINVMNTFVGRDPSKTIDEQWPRFCATWEPIIAHATSKGVKVGIENCPMSFTRDEWPGGKNLAISPRIFRRMFTAIPSPNFGLNFDPSHFIWQQMDYLKPLREFASRLHHMHAKDARLDRDRLDDVGLLGYPNDYHTPKLPGLGDVEWGKFFAVLSEVGYRGPVCVEVEDRAYEGEIENRKAALRQTARYLKQFMG